jgi:hypothetical protein
LSELAEELQIAEAHGGEQRAVKLENEKAAIEKELRRAFGRDGRARVAASVAEKHASMSREPSGWQSEISPA